MSDEMLKLLAARAAGRHPRRRGRGRQALPQVDGGASQPRCRRGGKGRPTCWATRQPGRARRATTATYIAKFDEEFATATWRSQAWREESRTRALIPTADEWAEQVDYVDQAGRRRPCSHRPRRGGRAAACRRRRRLPDPGPVAKDHQQDNVRKIAGENWLRVLAAAQAAEAPSVAACR